MGNLALHSAEEPDNLRATTGTVEVPTEIDNDAALVLGARPIQQHKPAARHMPPICKQNLLLFIHPRWQLRRTYFFNHYNVSF